MLAIFLTLVFRCGAGCGYPDSVTLTTAYETIEDCMAAGRIWLSPAANPTNALRGFLCEAS